MTYNPDDLMTVRGYLLAKLDLQPGTARGVDLEPNEVGIAGDPAHAASGGYHEGNDDLSRVGLLTSDYSKRESARDRPGTNAASALDIGDFDAAVGGRRITLRSLTLAIVDACKRGDPRTRDIREVIYTPNGTTVSRWDRLGVRSSGDDSHRWHTHISFHRDGEGRRAADDNILGLLKAIIGGGDDLMGVMIAGEPIEQYLPRIERALLWQIPGIANDTKAMKASAAAEATAITGLKTALDALAAAIKAGGGNVDVAAITAAIDAKTNEVKALVEQRHAEEMAELKRERDAEVASLQAQLDALRPTAG